MTSSCGSSEQSLNDLLSKLLDGELDDGELRCLTDLLRCDSQARELYYDHIALHAILHWTDDGLQQDAVASPLLAEPSPSSPPVLGLFSTAMHGAVGFFSQEIPFSLLIASVVTALGLLAGSLIYVSRPEQVVQSIAAPTVTSATFDPTLEVVARITGMTDCCWSKDARAPSGYDNVLVGRKFKLDSGLLEITYNSGARVILQGPCTYEVQSHDGGFLSIGKLTAKLEKKPSAISGQQTEKTAIEATSNSPNPQISKSSLSTLHSPLFTIRTPSAIVTDLGTEFGVEVSKKGSTTSHVFQGVVRLQAISDTGEAMGDARVLHENQSARVDRGITLLEPTEQTTSFVRRIFKRSVMTFDLVDVVAGGDGFGKARDRGIDPSSGKTLTAPPENFHLADSGRYHRVENLPLIDGVFIPCTGADPMQLDSAGHVFAFSDYIANPQNKSWGPIWAGGVIPQALGTTLGTTLRRGYDYSSPWHSVLGMHSNKGITFDLERIRHANPGCRVVRFTTVAGNPLESNGTCDVWVFVDGKLRFRRQTVTIDDGELKINVALNDQNRFLTLVSTDGGDGGYGDAVIFGDPHLVLEKSVEVMPRDEEMRREN